MSEAAPRKARSRVTGATFACRDAALPKRLALWRLGRKGGGRLSELSELSALARPQSVSKAARS